jgi:hypothetical protein
MAHELDFEAWRCKNDGRLYCPNEGCTKAAGCARDRGWKPDVVTEGELRREVHRALEPRDRCDRAAEDCAAVRAQTERARLAVELAEAWEARELAREAVDRHRRTAAESESDGCDTCDDLEAKLNVEQERLDAAEQAWRTRAKEGA